MGLFKESVYRCKHIELTFLSNSEMHDIFHLFAFISMDVLKHEFGIIYELHCLGNQRGWCSQDSYNMRQLPPPKWLLLLLCPVSCEYLFSINSIKVYFNVIFINVNSPVLSNIALFPFSSIQTKCSGFLWQITTATTPSLCHSLVCGPVFGVFGLSFILGIVVFCLAFPVLLWRVQC